MIKQSFKCSLSTAVFTSRFVVNQGKPITIVLHELDDGNWKFLSKEDSNTKNEGLVMVSLQEILMIDPTISEIAFLHEGNIAIRKYIGGNWEIAPIAYPSQPDARSRLKTNR
ncbi:MAG: hypothetical protein HXX13_13765 [Bacteroidetes bacterium]|nr:hypothetical protein [Bacteroidota bacterium]